MEERTPVRASSKRVRLFCVEAPLAWFARDNDHVPR